MGGTPVPRLFSAFAARPKTRGYPTRRPSHVQNRNDTNFRVVEFVVNGVGESATQQSVPFVPSRMDPGIETKFTQIAENTFEKVVTNLHAVRIIKITARLKIGRGLSHQAHLANLHRASFART